MGVGVGAPDGIGAGEALIVGLGLGLGDVAVGPNTIRRPGSPKPIAPAIAASDEERRQGKDEPAPKRPRRGATGRAQPEAIEPARVRGDPFGLDPRSGAAGEVWRAGRGGRGDGQSRAKSSEGIGKTRVGEGRETTPVSHAAPPRPDRRAAPVTVRAARERRDFTVPRGRPRTSAVSASRQVEEVAGGDHLAIVVGEAVDAASEPGPALVVEDRRLGRWGRIARPAILGGPEGEAGPPPGRAAPVPRLVGDDPEQPRPEGRAGPEPAERARRP